LTFFAGLPDYRYFLTMTDATATAVDRQAPPAHVPPTDEALVQVGPAPPLQIPRAGEEATILFGSGPSRLFDVIGERIDAALRDGVATLPFLEPDGVPIGGRASFGGARMSLGGASSRASLGGSTPPDEKLLTIIRNTYSANLDLAEAYAGRNVFALPVGTGPRRREEIVTAYLTAYGDGGTAAVMAGTGKENASNPNDDAVDITTTTNNSSSTATLTTSNNRPAYQIPPNKEAVPTSDQIASLDDETAQLRRKLRAARRMRSDLRSIVADMGRTHAVAVTAKRTIDESCIGGVKGDADDGDGDGAMKIQRSVAAAVAGREDLAALTASGKDLLTKLDEEKEARRGANGSSSGGGGGDDDDDDDGVVDLMESGADAAETSRPLTIEEDMERRRKIMRTGEKDGLAKVSALLKER